ncbi:putative mucin/carbohydrate-binding domain-containing protein [Clostridium tarantellae]|uniref:Putative mucin/carbohydrate-binding domain-containing protein n=1 Tax=Clostridium tarantellae TaxID=39493 RepID=A0A6I1MN82_9CLOT|nr:putative mucin/carbohydrate-binding domain-containing protein [Clostridium tarantellae]MPQ44484.1 hypothetical protein [Clostridium tarantellae]
MQIKQEKYDLNFSPEKTTEINFNLLDDSKYNLGIIKGIAINSSTKKLLMGCVVTLHKINNNLAILRAITYTNKEGEYIFSELEEGLYNITISALGYFTSQFQENIQMGKINSTINKLNFNENSSTGIISGVITDNNNKIIPNTNVILYSINSNKSLNPLAFTVTNSNGIYIFSNVPKGKFLIKSNKSEFVILNTFNEQNNAISSIFSSESQTNYSLSEGILSNGAKVNSNNNFVEWLGGAIDGSVTITVNIEKEGTYIGTIKYLANESSFLSIDINNIKSNTIYNPPVTYGGDITNAKTFTVPLSLNAGKNLIKFHGDGERISPDLESITLSLTNKFITENNEYNIALGTLSSGAKVEDTTNFVVWIGGPSDGKVVVNVNIDNMGLYALEFQYISADTDRPLKIDINESNKGSIYFLPKTLGGNVSDAKTFTVPIFFMEGNNEIVFHGNGQDYGPSLGMMRLKSITIPTTLNLTEGILINGAKVIEDGVVGWLGGEVDGSVLINYVAAKTGRYNLNITAQGDNSPLTIDINGINTGSIYNVQAISPETVIVSVTIPLNLGNNIIKFHGDGINYGPDLFKIEIDKVAVPFPSSFYNIAEGSLSDGARLNDSGEIVTFLGGTKKGSVKVTVNVNESGIYNLILTYISAEVRTLKIDINGENTGKVYRPEITNGWTISDAKNFTIPISLKAGNSLIKFYGDEINYSPDLVKFSIKSINTITIPTGSNESSNNISSNDEVEAVYNIAKGSLTNGAKIDISTNFVTFIGGVKDGASTIEVNVTQAGSYELAIQYIASEDRNLSIDVNNITTGVIYKLPDTGGLTTLHIKTFLLSVKLKFGKNTLKFHGDGLNYAPNLGTVSLKFKTTSLESNIFKFFGLCGNLIATLEFDTNYNTLLCKSTSELANIYLNTMYFSVVLYDRDGKMKAKGFVMGTENANKFSRDLDGESFNYGDYLRISHLEKEDGLKIQGAVIDAPSNLASSFKNIDLSKVFFQINSEGITFKVSPFSSVLPQGTYNISDGVLADGAQLNLENNFVSWIGGPREGSATITVNVEVTTEYKLLIQYLSEENRSFKLDINNIELKEIFNPPVTDTSNVDDAKIFIVIVTLNRGNNSIRFHGNGINFAPDFGQVAIVKNIELESGIYSVANGNFEGGARLNQSGTYAINIGGTTKGASTVTVRVQITDQYNMILNYINTDNAPRPLKIDVNGINTGKIYLVDPSDNGIFTTSLRLSQGDNAIKFYGDGVNHSPDLGKFSLNNSTSTVPSQVIPGDSYFLMNATLAGSAEIDVNTKFVGFLGGEKKGTATITVDVTKSAVYFLGILYLSGDKDRTLKIAVDNQYFNDGEVLPRTIDWRVANAQVYWWEISMYKGKHTLKFTGPDKEYGPCIGSINLNIFAIEPQSPSKSTIPTKIPI